ncbi:cysteine proteinase 1-like [Cydia pomonella]|uniref:cysteine proteinase 1-like n=1 Tax=Cydia pomonella TaxID=82600 RepID=UPI002ADD480C|nr:cysteine proteinase 1-like [Cydia pomonella]
MIDCGMSGVNGCNATYPHAAYKYIQSKGLPALKDYKFLQGKQDVCQEGKRKVTKIKQFHEIIGNSDKDVLRFAINKRSPVVVVLSGVDAEKSLLTITAGALDDTRWCGTSSTARHAVLAVGYDFTNKETFTIKNSWGEGWGEGGYADIVATHCGLLDNPSYPIVTQEDILE